MIQKFTTKRDRNGNRYTLVIDHERKTYARNFNPYDYSDYITIGKRDRLKLVEQLDANGYYPSSGTYES